MGHSCRDLIVWQKAKALAVAIYRATEQFPRDEIYGLTSQLRRCAVSVSSNIAEGQGRNRSGEFIQFLGHARGSILELQTQIEIALDLRILPNQEHDSLLRQSGEVLGMFHRRMESLAESPRSRAAATRS
jgi:four helix bundle protein